MGKYGIFYDRIEFQFHFGSIGRIYVYLQNDRSDVSIPLWFDWKKIGSAIPALLKKFQFHFGSIGRSTPFKHLLRCRVSIPLWFDWKQLLSTRQLPRLCFNSTLVRLEVDMFTNSFVSDEFQFHFGSIGSLQELKIKEIPDNVSIPLWFDWKNY